MPELLLCLQKYENRCYTHIMEKLSQLELHIYIYIYIYIYPFSLLYNTHNILSGATGTKGSVILFWGSTTEFKFCCQYNGNQQAHFLNPEYSCEPRATWCSEAGTHKMSTQPEQQSQQ